MKTAWELLEQLYFERVSGTEGEKRGADIIEQAIREAGVEAYQESFETQGAVIEKVSFEVLTPYYKQYEATAYYNSGSVEDLEADLLYYEQESDVLKKQAEGKVLLVNGYVGIAGYKKFADTKAKAFISYNGKIDHCEDYDLDQREFREPLKALGSMVGINIKVEDAMELVQKQAERVRITVKQTEGKKVSQNVLAEIDGYENKDVIVLSAHYDSVPNSRGIYDNATGCVALYDLIRYFKEHQPRHHLRFVFCGSEERGLLGSKAYCAMHEDALEEIKLNINLDMVGSIMGKRIAVATAEEALVHYTDYFAKEVGFPLEAKQGVYSSDSTPFADHGIPAISFARITSPGTGEIHNRFDVMEHLDERLLLEDIDFVRQYTERMANAYIIMVKREIPQNMKDEIDKYYGREKKEGKSTC
ncbi:MAG: M20/M25/M40 family metallo-hydrolase [Erysipelotrichaceae bacterium]|nr:M20/M25/M40 family metallo-hydrolase [Erysipelotrichaceae bacterium]